MPLSGFEIINADLQWWEQKPAPREGESRQAYIERRLAEMSHATEAYQAWVLFENAGDGMNWLRHLNKVNDRARGLYRIDFPHQPWRDFYLPPSSHEPFGCERVKEHNLGVFERRFAANRWDFYRPFGTLVLPPCQMTRISKDPTTIFGPRDFLVRREISAAAEVIPCVSPHSTPEIPSEVSNEGIAFHRSTLA